MISKEEFELGIPVKLDQRFGSEGPVRSDHLPPHRSWGIDIEDAFNVNGCLKSAEHSRWPYPSMLGHGAGRLRSPTRISRRLGRSIARQATDRLTRMGSAGIRQRGRRSLCVVEPPSLRASRCRSNITVMMGGCPLSSAFDSQHIVSSSLGSGRSGAAGSPIQDEKRVQAG